MSKKTKPMVKMLRELLHGVFNGDPEAERKAREVLYGKPSEGTGG